MTSTTASAYIMTFHNFLQNATNQSFQNWKGMKLWIKAIINDVLGQSVKNRGTCEIVNSSGIATSPTVAGSPSSNSFVFIVLIIDVFPQFSNSQLDIKWKHTISHKNHVYFVFHPNSIEENKNSHSNHKLCFPRSVNDAIQKKHNRD